MASTLVPYPIQRTGLSAVTVSAPFTTTGSTEWAKFQDTMVIVQLDGTATSVTAIVERTTLDPNRSDVFYYAPADDTPITGDPSSGISPSIYQEYGVAWWRVRLTAVAGGTCVASMSGRGQLPGRGD